MMKLLNDTKKDEKLMRAQYWNRYGSPTFSMVRGLFGKWQDLRSCWRNYEKFQIRRDPKITTNYNQVGDRFNPSKGIKRGKNTEGSEILDGEEMEGKVEEDKEVDVIELLEALKSIETILI